MTPNRDKRVKIIYGSHEAFQRYICEDCLYREGVNDVDNNIGKMSSVWVCDITKEKCLTTYCPKNYTTQAMIDRGYAALLGYAIKEKK